MIWSHMNEFLYTTSYSLKIEHPAENFNKFINPVRPINIF